jgi:hypothetical protein
VGLWANNSYFKMIITKRSFELSIQHGRHGYRVCSLWGMRWGRRNSWAHSTDAIVTECVLCYVWAEAEETAEHVAATEVSGVVLKSGSKSVPKVRAIVDQQKATMNVWQWLNRWLSAQTVDKKWDVSFRKLGWRSVPCGTKKKVVKCSYAPFVMTRKEDNKIHMKKWNMVVVILVYK